jgi:hypothetical protein
MPSLIDAGRSDAVQQRVVDVGDVGSESVA